jgi:DNA-binding transcriptional LysR family regulator
MELRHLRYLVAIADAGAFVRAAERLRVAQPALTRQIHDLEDELGAPLFDPAARKATLTPVGEACARIARHVLHDTEQAVTRARLSNSGIIGRCVIATGPLPIASGLVPEFLGWMRARFPGITLVVQERSGDEQWTAIERVEADIGLGGEPTSAFASLSSATQCVHKIDRVAVAPSHPLARLDAVTLGDLAGLPLLTVQVSVSPALERVMAALDAAMKEEGKAPAERRLFDSVESLLAHVRAGQGWTLAPSSMSAVYPGIAMLPLEGFEAVLPTVRIWRRTESRPVVMTVLDQLRTFQEDRDANSKDRVAATEGERDVVPPRLELRHLRSFLAVAQHGSLGRAAEVVGVTQPALSRQMRELEYDVGVALFSRESRGMDVTHAGESFRDDVRGVLAVIDKIPNELRRAERAEEQRCVIAVVPHPAVDAIVARVVADVEGRGRRVRVGTRPLLSVHQAKALDSGEIDIAMGHAFPVPKAAGDADRLITVQLVDDRISVALLAKNHHLASRATLHARDLADIPFLWPGRSLFPAFYDMVFGSLGAAGLRPRVESEYDGLTTIWSMVLQGGGWALGWKSHLTEPPPGLVAVPLADVNLPWGIEMTYRRDEARVPVLATIDALVEQASLLSSKAAEAELPSSHTSKASIS